MGDPLLNFKYAHFSMGLVPAASLSDLKSTDISGTASINDAGTTITISGTAYTVVDLKDSIEDFNESFSANDVVYRPISGNATTHKRGRVDFSAQILFNMEDPDEAGAAANHLLRSAGDTRLFYVELNGWKVAGLCEIISSVRADGSDDWRYMTTIANAGGEAPYWRNVA